MSLDLLTRGLVQALIAHALVSLALAPLVAAAWPRVTRLPLAPPRLARALFALRLLPAMAGLTAASAIGVAFALWEPRVEEEAVGVTAAGLAAIGAAMLGSGLWRGVRAWGASRRAERLLTAAARGTLPNGALPTLLIETTYPVVAVLGLTRARLVVARTVAEGCTADELRAVLAHELAHAGARDNLRRLALLAAPDALAWTPAESERRADWAAAAELAADDAAAADGGRLHLASALVKVARLATAPHAVIPASALFRGEPITSRVRRLLDPPTVAASPAPIATAVRIAALALFATSPLWLHSAYLVVESLLALP